MLVGWWVAENSLEERARGKGGMEKLRTSVILTVGQQLFGVGWEEARFSILRGREGGGGLVTQGS